VSLFEFGDFTLRSGRTSKYKINCDALTDGDWRTLASMLAERVPTFNRVIGIPTGGNKLAEMMLPHRTNAPHLPLLIVDDVLTSGESMREYRRLYQDEEVVGAVIFARGRCPHWVTPLFIMS
jgi:orotate phosphoribosyltransferase